MAKDNSEPNAKDLKFVKELMALLEESDLTEIDFQKGDLGISLSKASSAAPVQHVMAPAPAAAAPVGDTVMLVEAMKTFNPIVAPKSGKIEEILVDDASPVEFGEALFIIV